MEFKAIMEAFFSKKTKHKGKSLHECKLINIGNDKLKVTKKKKKIDGDDDKTGRNEPLP